jgi:hypothetical protein
MWFLHLAMYAQSPMAPEVPGTKEKELFYWILKQFPARFFLLGLTKTISKCDKRVKMFDKVESEQK